MIGCSRLKRDLDNAASYEEWLEAAKAYDKHHGHDRWRKMEESGQYDYAVIRLRLDELRSLKSSQDTEGLLYAINEGIHGNLGGMGKAGLYGHALSGTKYLIEEFIEQTAEALDLIAADDSGDIGSHEKLDFFRRASHCFGRTALMLSASGSLFPFHLGVARALLEAGIMPSVLSGSSGGSIAGGILCSHTDEELTEVLDPDFFLERITEADRRGEGPKDASLQDFLDRFVPDLTFQQALEKTGRSMNISIAPAETHQTSRLLNDTTSPAVLMHSAIRASCAVPGFFQPVTLEALGRDGKRKQYLPSRVWVDGAVSDNLPAKRLARLYGINHFIVSQVSPHVVPFVAEGQRKQRLSDVVREAGRTTARAWFNAMSHVTEATPGMPDAIVRANSIVRSLVNQDYVGDINIVADLKGINPLKLLGFLGDKQIRHLFEMGERRTWPKLEMIRLQTLLSRKLDSIRAEHESEWQAQELAHG
jgi:TAG lipase/steryl ester hydrolase/phospholipase A2/LPA acyltransferase